MKIGKTASSAEYRITDERFLNWQFWSRILVYQIEKNLEIC